MQVLAAVPKVRNVIYTFAGNSKALQQNSTTLLQVQICPPDTPARLERLEGSSKLAARLEKASNHRETSCASSPCGSDIYISALCSHVFFESSTIKVEVLQAWLLISNSCSIFLDCHPKHILDHASCPALLVQIKTSITVAQYIKCIYIVFKLSIVDSSIDFPYTHSRCIKLIVHCLL